MHLPLSIWLINVASDGHWFSGIVGMICRDDRVMVGPRSFASLDFIRKSPTVFSSLSRNHSCYLMAFFLCCIDSSRDSFYLLKNVYNYNEYLRRNRFAMIWLPNEYKQINWTYIDNDNIIHHIIFFAGNYLNRAIIKIMIMK